MTVVILSSVIATKCHNGGNAWAVASWIHGLRKLGFEVYFVEQIDPTSCVDADGSPTSLADSVGLEYFSRVTQQLGLDGAAALICEPDQTSYGLTRAELLDLAGDAALLVNVSGHLTAEWLKSRPRCRVYLDLDPGFTQLWHAAGDAGARLAGHDAFFTIGENIGRPGCSIPTAGITWQHTRQPAVLDQWPVVPADRARSLHHGRYVARAVRSGLYAGQSYGSKVHELRKLMDLPDRTGQCFELALDIHPDEGRDRALLEERGWHLVDPRTVAADPFDFRDYIQGSGAEFSVAQSVYAATECGWFSDRTVCYLFPVSRLWCKTPALARTTRSVRGSSHFERWNRPSPGSSSSGATTPTTPRQLAHWPKSSSTRTESSQVR